MLKLTGRFTESKGQGLTVLMVAVIASALIAGLVAVVMVENLPGIFGGFVDDAALISEAETRHDNIVENYIPTAVHYAVAQESWEVGTDNEVLEGDQDEPSDGMNWSDEIYPEYDEMIQEVDDGSDYEFRQYVQDFDYRRCKAFMIDESNMDVDPQFDQPDGMEKEIEVEATNDAEGLLNVSCGDFSREVEYTGAKSFFRVPIVNNKFPQLATLTVGAIAEMENVSEQLDTDLDDGKVTDTSSCKATKSAAKNNVDGKEKAEEKVEAFIEAIVWEGHGIGSGSGDRGAEEYLKSETQTDQMCLIICAPNWLAGFDDVPIRDLSVKSKDVAYEDASGGKSTSQCGCDSWECQDSGYVYSYGSGSGVDGGSCDLSQSLPEADCTNPDVSDVFSCDTSNLTCSGVNYAGDEPTTRDGHYCEPTSSTYPSPTCANKRWEASDEHKYDVDSIEVNVTLVDDEDGRKIPTDDGFRHPVVARTYSREFTSDGSYEGVN